MEIVHFINTIDLNSGGPSKSVSDLALNQSLLGHKVIIFTNSSAKPYLSESPHKNLHLEFAKSPKSFSNELRKYVDSNDFDLLHGHGIWQMPVHYMAQIAKRNKIPYLITPRGMLEPWALNEGKWKKKLALALYQRNDLAKADCIHATALMETENIRKLGFKNPVAVIPNGIDISEFPLLVERKQKDKKTLLFLSRIHPKKGIELLIEAWGKLPPNTRRGWQVEIAGNGEDSYIASLQQQIEFKKLTDECKIIGPQFGADKLAAYHRADLFVLPTYSENFGIVVAEALACGVPVITTKGAPWQELHTHKAGWWIEIGATPLAETLSQALQLPEEERQIMGQNSRKLVKEKYSIEAVAQQMIELYEWVLNKSEKPKFISYD